MTYESPFACVTIDHGYVADILPVSPVYVRCGPRTRGAFGERRLTRTRRTDARHERRTSVNRHLHADFTSVASAS